MGWGWAGIGSETERDGFKYKDRCRDGYRDRGRHRHKETDRQADKQTHPSMPQPMSSMGPTPD